MPASEPEQYLINGCYLSSLGLLDPNTSHTCRVNINWSQHPLVPGLPKTTLGNSSHPSSGFCFSQLPYWLQPSKPHNILCCSPAGGLCSFVAHGSPVRYCNIIGTSMGSWVTYCVALRTWPNPIFLAHNFWVIIIIVVIIQWLLLRVTWVNLWDALRERPGKQRSCMNVNFCC